MRDSDVCPGCGEVKKAEQCFKSDIITGTSLKALCAEVREYNECRCLNGIKRYLQSKTWKILILYGLQGTGKHTLIHQSILDMDSDSLKRTALIRATKEDTFRNLNDDLIGLRRQGYRYIFIENALRIQDFIENSSILSDRFAAGGMKITITDDDSLGFLLAENHELFDRCEIIHTTPVLFRDHRGISGTGVWQYMENGGILDGPWKSHNDYLRYIRDAITTNIRNSLSRHSRENVFRHIREMDEIALTDAVDRTLQDINLKSAIDSIPPYLIEDETGHLEKVVRKLMVEDTVGNMNIELKEDICRCLESLDIIQRCRIHKDRENISSYKHYLISIPRIRSHLMMELMKKIDSSNKNVSKHIDKIFTDGMLKDAVVSETLRSKERGIGVTTMQFSNGRIDMIVKDDVGCHIFVIDDYDDRHFPIYRPLVDESICKKTEHLFGPIKERCVIYRGATHWENDIHYVNVEEYLTDLGKDAGNGS